MNGFHKIYKESQESLSTRQDEPPNNPFEPEDSGPHQMLNSTFGVLNEENSTTDPIGYSEGIISPINDSEDLVMTLGKESSFKLFQTLAASEKWSSVITYDVDHDIGHIQKYSSSDSFGLKKDLRFSQIEKKYDLFYFNFSEIKNSDVKYCLNNIFSSARPFSAGFISGLKKEAANYIESFGFSRSSVIGEEGSFFIKKNDMSKLANIEIFDESNVKKAEFLCDIAETLRDKIAGLQPYSSLKYGSGLLFQYKIAQDVTYHMGSVSFPIDIIFIDSNKKVKKIARNILPGTLGIFGSADTLMVLEIAGGASNCLGIEVGNVVKSAAPSEEQLNKYSNLSFGAKNMPIQYIKNASFTRRIQFDGFEVFNVRSDETKLSNIIKTASDFNKKIDLAIYDFDEFLTSELGTIKFANNYRKYNIESIDENMREALDWTRLNKTAILSNFMASDSFTPFEIRKAFGMMKLDLCNNKKVVIATSMVENLDLLKVFIVKRAMEEVLFDEKIHSIEIISFPKNTIISNSSKILNKFDAETMSYNQILLNKTSSAQIPDEIKEAASNVLEYLSSAGEAMDDLISAFKNNSDQYLKIKDNKDIVIKSKDLYATSCKRLSRKIVKILLDVKKAIKIMGDIRDISSVDEKIEALALSCKEFVSLAEDIFDLESTISEDNFVDELISLTEKLEKGSEDIDNNINNFSDFILKNILNKKVLSR